MEVRHSGKGIAIGSGMAAAAAAAASLRDAPRNPFEMGEVCQGIHWGKDAEALKQQHKEPAPETDKTWPTEKRGGKTIAVFSEAYTDTKGVGWRYWFLGRRWVSRNERSGWRDLLKWTRGKEALDARKRAEVWREGQRVKRMKTATLAGVDYTPGEGHSVTTASDGLADDDAALLPVLDEGQQPAATDDGGALPLVSQDDALYEGLLRKSKEPVPAKFIYPEVWVQAQKCRTPTVLTAANGAEYVETRFLGLDHNVGQRRTRQYPHRGEETTDTALAKNSDDLGAVPDAPEQKVLDVPNTSGRVHTEIAFCMDRHTV